ncbi:MAG: orotidine-5'-phosphate decarboxylase [Rhodospirillales bacterium]|nr:orotidine-5'-phosphate decarboxylase [Rhodospirillales bacterium]
MTVHTINRPADRIFVALDTTNVAEAATLADRLKGAVGGVKLGKEFFTANGPEGVKRVSAEGMPVFLDLKFHDIPNTVAGAIRAALPLNPFMINVHASGGAAMMRAAAEAVSGTNPQPLLLAVTVLTSMADEDLAAIGVPGPVEAQVRRLAVLARDSGMGGVVCSAREIATLRDACGPDFALVVPGIRPAWAATDDQKRIMTPSDAVRAGADYLVIGRPITRADDPLDAAQRIAYELDGAA